MPRIYVHATFLFFALTALTGAWMRFFPIHPDSIFSYTNVLHGHSHLAILGWQFLALFLIFLTIFWSKIISKKQAISICLAIVVTSFLMFLAFVYQGYGVLSIAMSTIHIFVEYWVVVFIYRQLKAQPVAKSAKLFIIGALISLVISSIGPFSLGVISANGLKEYAIFDMAIYFYLHFQYNGWLTLFLLGLFVLILQMRGLPLNDSFLKKGFWIYIVTLFPNYFHSVLWVEELGNFSNILATIGGIGQWLGIILILVGMKGAWKPLTNGLSKLTTVCLAATFILLFVKSTMELGLMVPALADLVYGTRSVIIGYLHLTLLGFVSIFILAQYQLVGLMNTSRYTTYGFGLFIAGFILNELLLFAQAISEWLFQQTIPYFIQSLLLASLFLLAGVLVMWFAGLKRKASPTI